MKLTLLIFCAFTATVLSAIENKDVDSNLYGKKIGEECNGNDSDCLCAGSWVKCRCPWMWHLDGTGPCTCQVGLKSTLVNKLKCPNRWLWTQHKMRDWLDYYAGKRDMPPERMQ